MTILLLMAMLFSDGSSGTLGIRFDSYDACSKGMSAMQEKIKANNASAEIKVLEYAMSCVESRKAPKGVDS